MQLLKLRFNRNGKARMAILLISVFIFGLLGMVQPESAMAKTDESNPATDLTVMLNENEVAFELATYTISELESMPQVQREYSSLDSLPAPEFIAGKGIDLESFLTSLGIDINSVTHLRFYATDDVVKRMDRNMLLDTTRYYFPKIEECWDSCWDVDSYRYTDVQKASEGAVAVKPMLAITSSQGRWLEKPDWNSLDGSTCVRLCLGQASPEECCSMNFVRWIYKIEVFGKMLSGGGSSTAPKVTLNKPTFNQTYQVGDTVEIAGEVKKLSSITLTIADPDGHIVYTVFDLKAKDGSFTEEFPLGPDAVPGNYTINAGPGAVSSLSDTQNFRVAEPSASGAEITLNTPEEGQIVQPGDKVEISGSSSGLTSAKLEIIGPSEETVYISTLNKDAEFTEEFITPGDALPGDYTIQISIPGLNEDYIRVFKVAWTDEDNSSDTAVNSDTEPKSQSVFHPAVVVPTSSLKDISNHWAAEWITNLVARGAINGYLDGTFRPDTTISRAEFITAVVKAFNLTDKNGQIFVDTSGHWAQDYIATATAAGIIGGYNDSTFSPDDPITREQMAFTAVKAAHLTPAAGENQFNDSSSISDWAQDAVATAVSRQIMKGYPDNTFRPDGKATRAEAATVIVNALNLK